MFGAPVCWSKYTTTVRLVFEWHLNTGLEFRCFSHPLKSHVICRRGFKKSSFRCFRYLGPGKGCSHYFSYFFAGNIWFSGNGIQERGPLYKTTNSRKFNVVPNIKARSPNSIIFLDHPQIFFTPSSKVHLDPVMKNLVLA